jgi:hypothetical protein
LIAPLEPYQRDLLRLWLPAVVAGLIAWLAFVLIGQTPLLRAAGLAAAIAGVALALRWMGWLLAIGGALALAFTPAFWTQTGGVVAQPATVVLALSAAAVIGIAAVGLSRRPYIALGIALAAFAFVFASQIGVARSLRLTILAASWLIFLLTRAVLITNPRPDGPQPARLKAQYRAGILLTLALGVINDPLFVLFVPAVALALGQSKTPILWWYWAMLAGLVALGIFGIFSQYYDPQWWSVTTERALRASQRDNLPYVVAAGLRDGARWLELLTFVGRQFTIIGLLLSLLGLARMARWYPVLGVTTMVGYAAFFLFGLAYYGEDRPILLLPMLMMQTMWLTYAVYALGEWLERSVAPLNRRWVRAVSPVSYLVLPLLLLSNTS